MPGVGLLGMVPGYAAALVCAERSLSVALSRGELAMASSIASTHTFECSQCDDSAYAFVHLATDEKSRPLALRKPLCRDGWRLAVMWDAAMLFGYYVWINSMGLALVASPVRLRTLVAMVAIAAALGLMFGGSVWQPS